ncbi:MAG TPA: MBL fold metallo-hydrolase [Pseudonocardia sp.]|jgi:cyclase|nr:MBL fold metallo-hydrolase [Pseudonocardia sp.]
MSTGDHPEAPLGTATEVAEGVFAYVQPDGTWWINNTGFVVGRNRVTAVDACATERRTRAFLDTIRGVTSAPVRTLINTHHHGDHTYGNYLFEEATIVAHERAREAMLGFGNPFSAPFWTPIQWGDMELVPPFLTFPDRITHYVDDLRIEVIHPGTPGHTTNDSVLWIPEHKVAFTGDLVFNGGTPFLLMGSPAGALECLAMIRELGATTLVPGHGPVCGPEVLDGIEEYIHFVVEQATAGMSAGLTPLEVARDLDLGEFGNLTDPERIVGNLYRAYAELGGAERGTVIDMRAALTDMVAYNGGKPLTCHA